MHNATDTDHPLDSEYEAWLLGQEMWLLPFSTFLRASMKSWKVVAEPWKMLGFLASGGEEFNPGPETRLDCSELLCNKALLKYKR